MKSSGVTFLITFLALAALGVVAGLGWSWVSPRPPHVLTDKGPVLADPTTQALIAADGWFAVICGGLGLLSGVVLWLVARQHGVGALLGLALGGVAGSLVAFATGSRITVGVVTVAAASPGIPVVAGPLGLTAYGVLVAMPFLAVGVFAAFEGVVAYRESPMRQPYAGQPPLA